jgi:hypothetical protein
MAHPIMALVVVAAHLPWVETELLLLLEMVVLEPHHQFLEAALLMLAAEAVVLLVELLAMVVPVAVEMEQQTIPQEATELLTQVEVVVAAVFNRLEQ